MMIIIYDYHILVKDLKIHGSSFFPTICELKASLKLILLLIKYCIEGTEMRQLGFKVRRLLFLNRY